MIAITHVYADGSDMVTVVFNGPITDPGPADWTFRAGPNTTTMISVEQPDRVRVRFPEPISPGDGWWLIDQQPGWLSEELSVPAEGTCEAYP
jgi:hypothetical protein